MKFLQGKPVFRFISHRGIYFAWPFCQYPKAALADFEGMLQQVAFEKKKGQRKVPLAQQIYKNNLDALVGGVSLCQSPEIDAPHVNISYAMLELDENRHELVEKLYFDRPADFVYVELMRELQRD